MFQIIITLVSVGSALAIVMGGYAVVRSNRAPVSAPAPVLAPSTQTSTTHMVHHVNGPHLQPVHPYFDYRYSNRSSQHLDSYASYSLEMDSPPRVHHGRIRSSRKDQHHDFINDECSTKPKSRRSRRRYESDSEEEEPIIATRTRKSKCTTSSSRRKLESEQEQEREPKVSKARVSSKKCKPTKKGSKDDKNDDDGGVSGLISNTREYAKE